VCLVAIAHRLPTDVGSSGSQIDGKCRELFWNFLRRMPCKASGQRVMTAAHIGFHRVRRNETLWMLVGMQRQVHRSGCWSFH